MQLENHVLVMCIALRQFWDSPVHACRTMAIGVLLRSLVGSVCVRITFSHWRARWKLLNYLRVIQP